MTDNDIIKALECCIKSSHFGECFENKCPMVSEDGCKVGKETLYPYALDLIKRQKADYLRLEKSYIRNQEIFADQCLENEQLKAEIERLTKANEKWHSIFADQRKRVIEFAEGINKFTKSQKK